jgi:hypothetical protein
MSMSFYPSTMATRSSSAWVALKSILFIQHSLRHLRARVPNRVEATRASARSGSRNQASRLVAVMRPARRRLRAVVQCATSALDCEKDW